MPRSKKNRNRMLKPTGDPIKDAENVRRILAGDLQRALAVKKNRVDTLTSLGQGLGKFAGNTLGGLAGTYVGNPEFGRELGSQIGEYGGGELGRLVGNGDYKVKANSITKQGVSIPPGETVPTFHAKGHAVIVKHREFVQNIKVPASPTLFDITSQVINPGNGALFPWLSSVAQGFQQYKILGMIMEYRSLTGEVTAGGALGSVSLATDYNVLAPPFEDKLHMQNSEYAVSAKPSHSQIHTIECAPSATASKLLYVRNATNSSTLSQDARLYDLGKFQYATEGLPGAVDEVLGELWISYEIALYKPLIVDPVLNSSKLTSGGTVSKTDPFGDEPVILGSNFEFDDTSPFDTVYVPREGQYMVQVIVQGTGATASTDLTSSSSLIVRVANPIVNSTELCMTYKMTLEAGDSLTLDTTNWTTVTGISLRIAPYNYSY